MPPRRSERLLKTDAFEEAVGSGLYDLLARSSSLVVSMDISSVALRSARAHHPPLGIAAADVRGLPFAAGSFDVVVSTSTLDHFPSLTGVVASLEELHRVLRPGGTLLLTLDNLANPVIAVRNALPFRLVHALGLVPSYVGATCGPARLQGLLERCGFRVRSLTAILHCPRLPAITLAALLETRASDRSRGWYGRAMMAFEALGQWPTRFLTGNFLAVVATKGGAAQGIDGGPGTSKP